MKRDQSGGSGRDGELRRPRAGHSSHVANSHSLSPDVAMAVAGSLKEHMSGLANHPAPIRVSSTVVIPCSLGADLPIAIAITVTTSVGIFAKASSLPTPLRPPSPSPGRFHLQPSFPYLQRPSRLPFSHRSFVLHYVDKMSYADAAAKGPKQSPEEVSFNPSSSCRTNPQLTLT